MTMTDDERDLLAEHFCRDVHAKRWQPTERRRAFAYPCDQCRKYAWHVGTWLRLRFADAPPRDNVAPGEWLKRARLARGFKTAKDLGIALGWPQQRMSNYETGKSRVPDAGAVEIARVLVMDVADVRAGLGLCSCRDGGSVPTGVPLDAASNAALLQELAKRLALSEAG